MQAHCKTHKVPKRSKPNRKMAENTWKEDFPYNFSMRNQMISELIDFAQVRSLLDLGCGNQDLRRFVPEGVKYTGYDLYKHCPSTVIKDFNNGDRVSDDADVAVCSGFIEYLRDPRYMIADICAHCDTVVGSYNYTDDVKKRSEIWVNALSRGELDGYFRENGFARRAEIFRGDDTVFAYARVSLFTPPYTLII